MKTKLTFQSSKTLRALAQETLSHTQFHIPYEEKTTPKKSVFFVKDQGIYLMNAYCKNNGESKTGNHVVYARGYNPKTNDNCWDDSYMAVGGDDFAESIELTESALHRVAHGGNIAIEITDTTMSWRA